MILRPSSGGNGMFEMTNENVARLLRGLTIAVGSRKNRILIYQFLAAEIRALHYSYSLRIAEIVIMSNPPKPAERKRRQHTTTTKAAMPAAVHPRRPPQRQKLTRDELQ